MNVTYAAPPQAVRPPLTDHPTVEAMPVRGLWFGLVIAIPFWLVMAVLYLTNS